MMVKNIYNLKNKMIILKVANELLKKWSFAYKCYCSSEEIEEQKKSQTKKNSIYL